MQVNSTGLITDIWVTATYELMKIEATGKIKIGTLRKSKPKGIRCCTSFNRLKEFRHGALLYRIGLGKWHRIEQSQVLEVKESGRIEFMVNDVTSTNNIGAYKVHLVHYVL